MGIKQLMKSGMALSTGLWLAQRLRYKLDEQKAARIGVPVAWIQLARKRKLDEIPDYESWGADRYSIELGYELSRKVSGPVLAPHEMDKPAW